MNNDEKNPSTATCFPGSRHEKAWSGKFGGNWKKSVEAPETEVSG